MFAGCWRPFAVRLPAVLLFGTTLLWMGSAKAKLEAKTGSPPENRVTVEGMVTGPNGAPVVGALVAEGTTWGGPRMQTVRTDRQGRYRLADCRPGKTALTVVAPGLAPDLQRITVASEMRRVDFRLKEGQTLRVRVVDRGGKPIPHAVVDIPWWRDCCTLTKVGIPYRADSKGRWVWTWAPQEPVELYIIQARHACLLTGPVAPCKGEYVFTLPPRLWISGRVVDAHTKQPIERFRLTVRSVAPHPRDPVGGLVEVERERKGGRYRVCAPGTCRAGARVVRIEAPGYQPGVSWPVKNDEGDVRMDFLLSRAKIEAEPTGP